MRLLRRAVNKSREHIRSLLFCVSQYPFLRKCLSNHYAGDSHAPACGGAQNNISWDFIVVLFCTALPTCHCEERSDVAISSAGLSARHCFLTNWMERSRPFLTTLTFPIFTNCSRVVYYQLIFAVHYNHSKSGSADDDAAEHSADCLLRSACQRRLL